MAVPEPAASRTAPADADSAEHEVRAPADAVDEVGVGAGAERARPRVQDRLLVRAFAAVAVALAVLAVTVGAATAVAPHVDAPFEARSGPVPTLGAEMPLRSQIVAGDGSVLATLYDENRVWTRLDDLPPLVVDAVIDTEDATYWRNSGVDLRGSVRALRNTAQGDRQGGSTITQQLVKLEAGPADRSRSVSTKLREAVLARRLSGKHDKRAVLERYLNLIYFGNGAYGIGAAAERYFGVAPAALRPAQAAMLAGLISSPSGYDPFTQPAAATARRQHVLTRMVELGHLSPGDAASASTEPLPAVPVEAPGGGDPSIVAAVERELLADPRLGRTEQARHDLLLRGGLTIRTTVDPALQALAVRSVSSSIPRADLTASLVSIDPQSGAIRALVGGTAAGRNGFNVALQGRRQPGSSFKAITLAAALEAGHNPNEPVDGTAPCSFPVPPPQRVWNVDNYDGEAGGVTTLADATAHSLNCAYARLVLDLGPAKVVDMAKRLGVRQPLEPLPSITLGAEAVSPLDMASAFATLAADGLHHDPYTVAVVTDRNGKDLIDNQDPGRQVVDPEVARMTTAVLRGVITGGTGRAADIGRPAAGKTGTAEDWHDAWFCGYVPQLATVVWMGSPAGEVPMKGIGGINIAGGTYPAQIWHNFMLQATAALPAVDFTAPDPARWAPPPPVAPPAPTDTTTTTASTTPTTAPRPAPQPGPGGKKKRH